ncbi:MAG: hypothetical protein IKL55_00350 [Clostridia bacterium]|nr:hypothetical protein [Clostridia bacterium]
MIIFRPHRGGLEASMQEAREFNNVEEMKAHIVKLWHEGWHGPELFTADDIVIDDKSEVNDERIGWEDSKHVCVKRMGDEDYMKKHGVPQCIGMCATKYSLKT